MSAVYLQKRRWRIAGLMLQRTLIDHGILARPLKAAHQATAAALISATLLLVVAGVRLGVAIASHLAFESLLAFAEEAVHFEGLGGLSNGK
jgi:hypothetical protein